MARKATKAKAEEKTDAPEKPKYGVTELAEALGIEGASVRVKLRKSKFEKTGRSWGWNTKKEFDEVVKELKASEKAEASDGDDEKPKRRSRGKKAA